MLKHGVMLLVFTHLFLVEALRLQTLPRPRRPIKHVALLPALFHVLDKQRHSYWRSKFSQGKPRLGMYFLEEVHAVFTHCRVRCSIHALRESPRDLQEYFHNISQKCFPYMASLWIP